MTTGDGSPKLLPSPKHMNATGQRRALPLLSRGSVPASDRRVHRAFDELVECVERRQAAGCALLPARFSMDIDRARSHSYESYGLHIGANDIQIVGGGEAGCFYGLQTLRQLIDTCEDYLPICQIDDFPTFEVRGLLHDVTRGKSPTLVTLKRLVDYLAALKINQLQLYIEHAFVFFFDPEICDPANGMTALEVKELDAYARERFVELVPAVATLGHMGRILSLPRYRHLAEIEASESWRAMDWPRRARGLTLDVVNPESLRLVESIWCEVLAAFSSRSVNICGDEPWDIGRGRNRGRFNGEEEIGRAYVDHLLFTCRLCERWGRRCQLWSDVIRNHPKQLHRLPKDLSVLHWGYDDKSDVVGAEKFVEAGFHTLACPGTSGWKRVLNGMTLAERNIQTFTRVGAQCGAKGLLNTDWGDHGHFNGLACSLHGIAMAAALAWNADQPTGDAIDASFARLVLGSMDGSYVSALRGAATMGDVCETWRLLWQPMEAVVADDSLPTRKCIESAAAGAADFEAAVRTEAMGRQRDTVDEMRASSGLRASADDLRELSLACRFTRLFAEKAIAAIESRDGKAAEVRGQIDMDSWRRKLASAAEEYGDVWRRRNKPSGLNDILRALDRAGRDFQSFIMQ